MENKTKLAIFGFALLLVVGGVVSAYAFNGSETTKTAQTPSSAEPVKSCGCSAGSTGSCGCGAEGGCGCSGSCGGSCGCSGKIA